MSRSPFDRSNIVDAFRATGLCAGDSVFFQVSYEKLGVATSPDVCAMLYSAMREAVGPEGTILVPAYSLSFSRGEGFDMDGSPSIAGAWSSSLDFLEYVRSLPGAVRSADPMFSVAGMGPRAEVLFARLPNTSFGKDCLHERLMRCGGKICVVGGGIGEASFLHYVEESVGVPFRYRKLFTGRACRHGKQVRIGWLASVPVELPNADPDGQHIAALAHSRNVCRSVAIGRSQIAAIDCADLYHLAVEELRRNPWVTAKGPAADLTVLQTQQSGKPVAPVQFEPNASMAEWIYALWRLPRDIVSDGYDTALQALATQLPMNIHEYPTGTECWTWLVPEKWTCREAWLETLEGERLFSYEDNPLHVVSYSLPIDREVSRAELFEHLHVHAELPDAIPFIFKYYERDWGLCCSRRLKESLRDESYRVVIRSEFGLGTLKVGEVVAPGKSEQTFVLCAHLCHPAMVNDDLSGVVVGLKAMQALLQRTDLRYTYRFLILPETIGSVAYLSHHQHLIPHMKGGLFLEMLGLQNPHALQLSFAGDTEADRCLSSVLNESEPNAWTGAFRTVVGNDERQFNAPGVRVPMLSLSRVRKHEAGQWPYYPEYHSSHDNPELVSIERLEESVSLVLRMIDAWEGNQVPVNLFQGEIFCSRYGLHVDAYADPEGNRALFDILFQIDGTRSVSEIARLCRVSVACVHRVVDQLRELNLAEYAGSWHSPSSR